jgi:hypothetical protein
VKHQTPNESVQYLGQELRSTLDVLAVVLALLLEEMTRIIALIWFLVSKHCAVRLAPEFKANG